MADLVTLEEAKQHLRLSGDDSDADVGLRVQQASAIVLDYLKSRVTNDSTITSSSVASPTVITTSADHTFVDGDTVTIVGHTDSDPALDGSYVISSVTANSFTVPVAVLTAGTGGTASAAWSTETVPRHVHAATLLVLEDLYERRPIDWDAQRLLLERSRDPALA